MQVIRIFMFFLNNLNIVFANYLNFTMSTLKHIKLNATFCNDIIDGITGVIPLKHLNTFKKFRCLKTFEKNERIPKNQQNCSK